MANKLRLPAFLRNQKLWIIIHDVLEDSLALLIFSLAALMTAESLIPGFISSHLNLAKMTFGIVMLFFITIQIGISNNISTPKKALSKWLLSGIILWLFLLTAISLFKFPVYAIVIILTITAIIFHLLFQTFQEAHR